MTIQELFDIDIPIIQAPMAGVQTSALAIAVANSGGLGSLPCALLSPDGIREEVRKIETSTSHKYNVNFFCHTEPKRDEAAEAMWRRRLKPYYEELGVDESAISDGPTRTPFNVDVLDTIAECKPPVVSFHFGLPPKKLLDAVRAWRPKILASATTVEEALWLDAQGVDAIIAQGYEAGGHRGIFLPGRMETQPGTFALIPEIANAVQTPVIAAGGIADAQGVRAALELGAAGVQIGTAYLLCSECTTSSVHRAALKSLDACTTAVSNVFTGRPARGIVNRIMRELNFITEEAPPFPLAASALLPLRKEAEKRGSGDFSAMWCGQNATGCTEAGAATLTDQLAAACM